MNRFIKKANMYFCPMKYFMAITVLFISACSALEGEQKTNVNDIIKSQEIKRVSKAEIMIHAEKIGKQVENHFRLLIEKKNCDFLEMKNDTTLIKTNGVLTYGFKKIDFTTIDEQQTFEAYQYNAENQMDLTSSIQPLGQDKILYAFASLLKVENLKACNIDTTNSMGMWSIIFPVSAIVNDI
ncbi:MAG: hypothetical protein JXR07_07155 [Reichenbachiella sp.]